MFLCHACVCEIVVRRLTFPFPYFFSGKSGKFMVLAGGRAEGGGREPLCSHAQLICTLGAIFRRGERNTSRSKKGNIKKRIFRKTEVASFPPKRRGNLSSDAIGRHMLRGKGGKGEGKDGLKFKFRANLHILHGPMGKQRTVQNPFFKRATFPRTSNQAKGKNPD